MNKIRIFAIVFGLLLLFGCSGPEWKTFSDEKFSMLYPAGTEQQTQGSEVFKTNSENCQISVSKFGQQSDFPAFVNYIKNMWGNVSGLTIENEYVSSGYADFSVRAFDEENSFKGSIRLKPCEGDTVYVVMVGCERTIYDLRKSTVDKIIDSVECD